MMDVRSHMYFDYSFFVFNSNCSVTWTQETPHGMYQYFIKVGTFSCDYPILFLLSAIYLKFCEFGISLDLVFCWFTSPCSCIFFFKGGVGGVCVVKSAKQ